MAKSEVIKTKRLLIEPFSPEHITGRYVAWLNNPAVMRYSEQRFKRHTERNCYRYMESFKGTPHYFWAIRVQDGALGHIGNINAYVDKINRTADVGILIGEKKARHKGYATEAFKAVCSYLFEKADMRKITAGTISPNVPMLRLMRRVGMFRDGRRKRQYLWKNKEVDVVYAAIFKEQFQK